LRSLVQRIVLTPEDGEIKIELIGDLAGILSVAANAKAPATGAGASQVELVAGARSDQNLRTQKSRPVRAADLSN